MAMMREMPVKAAARIVGEHDTRLWRTLLHYVDKARASEDHSGVSKVGVDETSHRRGQSYVTLFADLERSKVLFATPGRDSTTVARFKDDLETHGGAATQIREFTMDMSEAFRRGGADQLRGGRDHCGQVPGRPVAERGPWTRSDAASSAPTRAQEQPLLVAEEAQQADRRAAAWPGRAPGGATAPWPGPTS